MKKNLLFTAVLIGGMALAQTSGVGIQTDKPTETLQVNGTVRINDLPSDGQTNAIYTKEDGTASNSKDQTFKARKFVVVDKNGVLGQMELGEWSVGSITTVNTDKDYQTVDYTDLTNLKSLYVISDESDNENSHTITVKLPKNNNVKDNKVARVFRVVVMPTGNNTGGGSVILKGNIGNYSNGRSSAGITIKHGESVTLGNNSQARYGGIVTFIEINGKWYVNSIL